MTDDSKKVSKRKFLKVGGSAVLGSAVLSATTSSAFAKTAGERGLKISQLGKQFYDLVAEELYKDNDATTLSKVEGEYFPEAVESIRNPEQIATAMATVWDEIKSDPAIVKMLDQHIKAGEGGGRSLSRWSTDAGYTNQSFNNYVSKAVLEESWRAFDGSQNNFRNIKDQSVKALLLKLNGYLGDDGDRDWAAGRLDQELQDVADDYKTGFQKFLTEKFGPEIAMMRSGTALEVTLSDKPKPTF